MFCKQADLLYVLGEVQSKYGVFKEKDPERLELLLNEVTDMMRITNFKGSIVFLSPCFSYHQWMQHHVGILAMGNIFYIIFGRTGSFRVTLLGRLNWHQGPKTDRRTERGS